MTNSADLHRLLRQDMSCSARDVLRQTDKPQNKESEAPSSAPSSLSQQGHHNARQDPLKTTIKQQTGHNIKKKKNAPQPATTRSHKEQSPERSVVKTAYGRFGV